MRRDLLQMTFRLSMTKCKNSISPDFSTQNLPSITFPDLCKPCKSLATRLANTANLVTMNTHFEGHFKG